jgi:hypothetical protein
MKDLIDNTEVEKVLAKLEQLEDEELAVKLLREFNDATRELGTMLMNKDQSLTHEEWKEQCDKAKQQVDAVLAQIEKL